MITSARRDGGIPHPSIRNYIGWRERSKLNKVERPSTARLKTETPRFSGTTKKSIFGAPVYQKPGRMGAYFKLISLLERDVRTSCRNLRFLWSYRAKTGSRVSSCTKNYIANEDFIDSSCFLLYVVRK